MSESTHPIRRILVAVDGSEPAAHALRWAVAMARGMGAEVVAVYAIPPFPDLSLGFAGPWVPPQADPQWRRHEKTFESDWCAPLRESGLPHRMVLEDGRPATVIGDLAESEGCRRRRPGSPRRGRRQGGYCWAALATRWGSAAGVRCCPIS